MKNLRNNDIVITNKFIPITHENREWFASNKINNLKSKNSIKFKSFLDYASRKNKTEIVVESDKKAGYLGYMNQSYKITSEGHFTREHMYTNKEFIESYKKEVPNESMVWSMVISFREVYQFEHDITSKEKAAWIVKNTIGDFFQENKMDPKAFEYIGQFHVDTPHHFHIHLRIHEKFPSKFDYENKTIAYRKKGKFTETSLRNWKSNIDKLLVNQKVNYIGFNDLRDKIIYRIKDSLETSVNIKEVIKKGYEIKKLIPQGRFQYNAIKKSHIKNKIDSLIKYLIDNNPEANKAYLEGIAIIDKISLAAKDKATSHIAISNINKLQEQKKKELWSHMANVILKVIKNGLGFSEAYKKLDKEKDSLRRKETAKRRNKIIYSLNKRRIKKLTSDIERSLELETREILSILEQHKKEVRSGN